MSNSAFPELTLRAADDFHIHLRNDEERTPAAIRAVTSGGVSRVMVMPNTDPAIATGEDAHLYKKYLRELGAPFTIHTTIKLTQATKPEDIEAAAMSGVLAGKQYPLGVTTNSQDGVSDVKAMYPVYQAMADHDMVLSLHGEVPDVFVMDAETAFLEKLIEIHRNFPHLRIVLEHITTSAAIDVVSEMSDKVAATITDHHLAITLHDIAGTELKPHLFCKPLAKRPEDRKALNEVVRSGHPRFFSGTDSAPHLRKDKECASGCAGVFNSAYHMQFLATHFAEQNMLNRLEDFTSKFGAEFYQLPLNETQILLKPKPWEVPKVIDGLVPFKAGETLRYSLSWS